MLLTLLYRVLRRPILLPAISPQKKYTTIYNLADLTVHACARINQRSVKKRITATKTQARIMGASSGIRGYTVAANQLLGSEHAF